MDTSLLWHIPLSHYNEKARWALDRIPDPLHSWGRLDGVDARVSPRQLGRPMVAIGRGNVLPRVGSDSAVEIYLTHMFVVIGFFVLLAKLGRPLNGAHR
jgi:hypothetical protein